MNDSTNLGGLTGLLNDYPEEIQQLLKELRLKEEQRGSHPARIASPRQLSQQRPQK